MRTNEPLLGKIVLIDLAMHKGVWEVVEEGDGPMVEVERRGDCLRRFVDRYFVKVLKEEKH